MNKKESLEKIESLIRRTGSRISNKASAADILIKWTAPGASGVDPFNFKPKPGIETEIIDALKLECYKAADIVATWGVNYINDDLTRKLFIIPELCLAQVEKLALHQNARFLKASLLSPYKSICKRTTLYSTEEFKEGFLRRHVEAEIECPGAYSHRGNPYGEMIKEIARISSALSTVSSPPPPPLPPLPPSPRRGTSGGISI